MAHALDDGSDLIEVRVGCSCFGPLPHGIMWTILGSIFLGINFGYDLDTTIFLIWGIVLVSIGSVILLAYALAYLVKWYKNR